MLDLAWLLVAVPLVSGLGLLVWGKEGDRVGHLIGTAASSISFVIGAIAFIQLLGRDEADRSFSKTMFTWIEAGPFHVDVAYTFDPLSGLFVLLITGVGSLIHIYSIGYMEHDARRRRFFAYLNIFIASMLTLVLASDYLVMFLGWEGVGLASYLLIGFWQHKDSAATAATKAFVVNRVGDLGMALGDHADVRPVRHVGDRAGERVDRRGVGRRRHHARPAPPARRLRQVGPGAAAELAARRDGGPDPGLGAHPRRNDGHRGRLPRRPLQRHLRRLRDGPHRGHRRRPRHAARRCLDRLRQGRHQEGARRLHDEPDRLHDAGRRPRPGRLRVRDLPPAHARLLQGQPVPRRRLDHARHERRRGDAALRRPPQGSCRSRSSRSCSATWRSSASRASPASSPRTRSSRRRSATRSGSASARWSVPASPRST